VSISPLRDATRRITHYVATQEDVTERKRAERTLREREALFRELADNISEVFFVADAGYREMLYVNAAYEKIWGRSTRELYDQPRAFLEHVFEEDQPRVLDSMNKNQRGEETDAVEFRVVRPDGSTRWVLGHSVPIRNERGEVYRISGVVRDVTEQHRARDAVAESEARFRALTEASFDGIAIVEAGVVRDANRGFADMFRYTQDEVIARPMTDFVAPESVDDVSRRITQGLEGRYEFVGVRKDGHTIVVEATSRIHRRGTRSELVTALRDITDRRLLEDQFRQAQKMEAVGRLAGGVAHDFNNLLTVITSYADLVYEEMTPADPRQPDVDQIRKAADAAAALTRQLLAFSRQQIIQPRPVVLEEIIGSAQRMLKRLIGEDVELESVLQSPPSTVMIDAGQLEQALMNLVVNARDAMPTGGKLTLETSRVMLNESYAATHVPTIPGRYAVLAVSDTGIGMDKETRARIFEPFFTTKETGKGTGLGLAMVYGIVKQSGGFIWVYSEQGRGSTFKIYLPLIVDEPSDADAGRVTETRHGSETILLVEDSPAVRAAARQILERYGYHVLEASSATEALDIVARARGVIDLLVTDVVMPGISGRELAERLQIVRPELKVLFMSGYTDDAVVRHGVLASEVSYLQKPFSPDALARKVREVIDSPS
jgi:PAS domain S-box-containing protein